MKILLEKRKRRHRRIRSRIQGTLMKPRLCVFRSHAYIYVQLIDDSSGKVLCSTRESKTVKGAEKAGEALAKKAVEKKISQVVFDRGGYKYHGRIKALAEGARAGGLKF